MPQWLSDVFEKSGAFMPHGHCYFWLPGLLWLHVVSDVLIGLAYVGISLVLVLLVRKIRLPFGPLAVAFGLFIGLCGLTHFMAVWTVWNPDYWLAGMVKAATAAASVATAIGLFYIRPQVEEVVHAARLSEERRIQLESTNAELSALYKQIKAMDELKTQFFANVSHELRTPLSLILGPAEQLLGSDNLSDEQRRQLTSISRNGKSLLNQVNDLLDVAKLEEGKMRLQPTRFDLAAVLKRIAAQFELAAEQRHIRYRIEAPDSFPVEADAAMLERVLVNLLANAFKFTPQHGEIRIVLFSDGDSYGFSVSDTGPGIEPHQHQTIFERFRQADEGATRRRGGTGLGLAIASDFVALHGGSIEVDSSVGEGSTFIVRLPLRRPTSAPADGDEQTVDSSTQMAVDGVLGELAPRPETRAHRENNVDLPTVLVVEDTSQMTELIVDVLGERYNLVTAEDGRIGLEKALTLQPDLLITDIMMPRMSGDQLVAELRTHNQFDNVPILLLSAKADDDLRIHLLKNGAQDYLTKPFLPQELIARVHNLIAMKRAGDALRQELTSASSNIELLAHDLAAKHSQLQLAFDAAEVARGQAERASEVKSHFLAMVSHELRTPLSTIVMSAQLLCRQVENESPAALKPRLERVARASAQLSTLVEGILEYTRAESGKIQPQQGEVDVVTLAKEVVDIAQLQVDSSEVELRIEPPATGICTFQTDPRLLRVILNNLISNALKFTPKGVVTVAVKCTPEAFYCAVQDTGLGIPNEDLGRVFLPFEQVEPVQRKSIPGVGLGLAVTKELVELLEGKIEVTSEEGVGSTFEVYLPAPNAANR